MKSFPGGRFYDRVVVTFLGGELPIDKRFRAGVRNAKAQSYSSGLPCKDTAISVYSA